MASGNDIAVLVLSPNGLDIAAQLQKASPDFSVYVQQRLDVPGYPSFATVGEIVSRLFERVGSFVFIMASGIAVRTLAPLLTDKLTDPGAVVVDEAAEHVYSLVGGHEGGANSLAYRVASIIGARPIISTGSEVAKALTVGVGCRQGASAEAIETAITAALNLIGSDIFDVRSLATIDKKRDEPGLLEAAARLGRQIEFFSADQLRAQGGPVNYSSAAWRAFGVGGVCETAALSSVGVDRLVLEKQVFKGVTIAIAARPFFRPRTRAKDGAVPAKEQSVTDGDRPGSIALVGIGQGDGDMSQAALAALAAATDVVGYKTYIKAVAKLLNGQTVYESGMGREVERARLALKLAAGGRQVAVVSSGDSGIYGMAGPVLEVLSEAKTRVNVSIIPGVTAASAAAAAVGAPLMNDFAAISLSDLLTPWDIIAKRLKGAAAADLVIVLYNPKSRGRQNHLSDACRLIRQHRSGETPAAVVRNAGPAPEVRLTDLKSLPGVPADMRSTIIIGNSQSAVVDGWFITRRGYRL